MSKSISYKIAYILIILSFILFAISAYLSFKKNQADSLVRISSDDLSITERSNSYLNDKKNDTNTTSNNSITNNETIKKKTTTVKTTDHNELLRIELENKYNIDIKYGEEVNGYSVGGMSVIPIDNYNDNSMALENLSTALSRYPDNFFDEMHTVYPLTIYLIDTYSVANVTGVTDSTNPNYVNISIATAYPFDDSFNHETYHYIEHYLNYKNGFFTTWESLNPTTFIYNNVNSDLSYSRSLSEDAYFVSDYAQVSPTEDRASTFEYMMASTKPSCLNEGKPIYLKAKYMSDLIDFFMDSVNDKNTEYWERFL